MSKCLIILENPWGDTKKEPGMLSVLPFFKGLETVYDDLVVYYSTFYDETSLETALEYLNARITDRKFLYIAAHGTKSSIASIKSAKVINAINQAATKRDIEGAIIGACGFGSNFRNLEKMIQNSNLHWVMAYTKDVGWLESTLLDLFVMNTMIGISEIKDKDDIFKQLTSALFLFNPGYKFSSNEKGPHPLKDSLALAIRGHREKIVTNFTESIDDFYSEYLEFVCESISSEGE